jgi:hypothetical protein
MKTLYLLIFSFLLSFSSYSQVSLSNLNYTTSDVPFKEPGSPLADSAFSFITFNVANLKAGDEVKIMSGTAQGKEDLQSFKVVTVVKDGKTYLSLNGAWFPVENGLVTIRKVIPKVDALKRAVVSLEVQDKAGKKYAVAEVSK